MEDPSAAVEKYVAHFEQQGFVETNRFDADVPSDIGSGYYTTLTLKGDDGGLLIYQAGNHLRTVSVRPTLMLTSNPTFRGSCSVPPRPVPGQLRGSLQLLECR